MVERNLTKKEERIREKEMLSSVITNKMTLVFLALVFAVVVLVRVSTLGGELAFVMALPYIRIAFGALTAASLVWWLLAKRRGVNFRMQTFSAPLFVGLFASGLFASLMYTGLGGAFRTVLVLLAFALLFFVYQIYAVDFFLCSVSVVVGCIAAAVVGSAGFANLYLLAAIPAVFAAIVAAAACIYVTFTLDRYGKMVILGKKIRRPIRMVPTAIYVAAAAALLGVLVSALVGYLLYCIAAVIAVYLVVAIIYTVRLM